MTNSAYLVFVFDVLLFYTSDFHISVSWWSFTGVSWWSFIGVRETACLLKSLRLFSEFWPISATHVWSRFFFWFQTLPVRFSVFGYRSKCTNYNWYHCHILKSQGIFCISFSRTDTSSCLYHLVVWSNFNFLHTFHWITFPTPSCLVSYSFCASLLHSLIMGKSFRFNHFYQSFLSDICFSVGSYLLSLQHSWSLWRWFVLLLE